MPEQYKKTIVQVVKKFPNVTFIWKYEVCKECHSSNILFFLQKPEHKVSAGVANLIESTWVPQRDLLRQFIPHLILLMSNFRRFSSLCLHYSLRTGKYNGVNGCRLVHFSLPFNNYIHQEFLLLLFRFSEINIEMLIKL